MADYNMGFNRGLIVGLSLRGLPIYLEAGEAVVISRKAGDSVSLTKRVGLSDGVDYGMQSGIQGVLTDTVQIKRGFLSDSVGVELI